MKAVSMHSPLLHLSGVLYMEVTQNLEFRSHRRFFYIIEKVIQGAAICNLTA